MHIILANLHSCSGTSPHVIGCWQCCYLPGADGAVVSALQDPRPASQALGAGGTSAAGQEAAIQLLSTVQALMAVLPLGSLLADPAAAGDNDSLAAGGVQPKGHPGEPLSSRCVVNGAKVEQCVTGTVETGSGRAKHARCSLT